MPLDLPTYVTYRTEFAQWIPQQSDDPAWTEPGTDEQQEVYDRLCHFYWLIDQEVGSEPGRIVENGQCTPCGAGIDRPHFAYSLLSSHTPEHVRGR